MPIVLCSVGPTRSAFELRVVLRCHEYACSDVCVYVLECLCAASICQLCCVLSVPPAPPSSCGLCCAVMSMRAAMCACMCVSACVPRAYANCVVFCRSHPLRLRAA